MRTEIRFLLAVVLMIAVLVITNLLFPPVPPEEPLPQSGPETAEVTPPLGSQETEVPGEEEGVPAAQDPVIPGGSDPVLAGEPEMSAPSQLLVSVRSGLYEYTFSNRGARLLSARLLSFPSFTFPGPVELVSPDGNGALGTRVLIGGDTLDLRDLTFEVQPADGLELPEGGGERELHFTYRHPTHPFTYEVTYTFHPDLYIVDVSGRVSGVDGEILFTDLGSGIPFNEQRERDEARASAYVLNQTQQGIRAEPLSRVSERRVEEGPFFWVAFKSKYFVFALLAGATEGEEAYLGGVIVQDGAGEHEAELTATQSLRSDGSFAYRLFMGPQEFARLSNLGEDMQNVNPYGWRFVRPIVRPFVGIIMAILTFLHENLRIGYGWVLVLFGLLMRVVLFPLNQKAMRSQIKNMAVQPLLQEIQAKHKDNPEKLQKEMLKLYKEHGYNPLGGCLPMLLPWPVLIALFFVFQNTIELRGVPFLWLPDLSAPDPYYILPLFLGVSMFLLQWVSMRSMPQTNQQMKMMMYFMPIMMVFIFFQLASGLNLYYSVANIATLPQQIWIAGERKKAQAKGPLTTAK
ncbi:MAG: membrane protein insertase YidC [Longimicrobiales bacterium]